LENPGKIENQTRVGDHFKLAVRFKRLCPWTWLIIDGDGLEMPLFYGIYQSKDLFI